MVRTSPGRYGLRLRNRDKLWSYPTAALWYDERRGGCLLRSPGGLEVDFGWVLPGGAQALCVGRDDLGAPGLWAMPGLWGAAS